MRKLNIIWLICGIIISAFGQNKPSAIECSFCKMDINDNRFAAEARDKDNVYNFDALECLINFIKTRKESDFERVLVANYSNEGQLIDAKTATYLKSNGIVSPMGANLSAYETRQKAEDMKKQVGGELFNWKEIKARFATSKFGQNHQGHHNHQEPNAYAPVGVMGDHQHYKGGVMFSVRYMEMNMEGNLSGSTSIQDMEIFQNYMVAPLSMTMRMYMIGAMYAPTDKLTLMVMQNFVAKSMNLSTMMGANFSTQAKGAGDLSLTALFSIIRDTRSTVHLNGGISLPLAKINYSDDTPMMETMKLPYTMQLGSGTTDYSFGATFKTEVSNLTLGVQQSNTFRSGENNHGYKLGNLHELNVWAGYEVASWININARMKGVSNGQIDGADEDLNPMMVTTANTDNTGFKKGYAFLGSNLIFKGFILGLEYGLPIYQDVRGIQMDEGSTFAAGLRFSY
ncbi:MAG: transporter [Cytophagales bacterium]|nr:transporter [Cytophagales bacterium]